MLASVRGFPERSSHGAVGFASQIFASGCGHAYSPCVFVSIAACWLNTIPSTKDETNAGIPQAAAAVLSILGLPM